MSHEQAAAPRRRRLSVDLPPETEAATRTLANNYFRGVTTDAIRASLSLIAWVIEAKRAGKRVIAVRRDRVPDQFEEPVLPGIEEQLLTDATWLVQRPHPWRRQPWIKGRRLTAGDLARTIEIEGWTPEQAAAEFDLPVEAVLEAQRYLVSNRDLVLAEEQENVIAAHGALANEDIGEAQARADRAQVRRLVAMTDVEREAFFVASNRNILRMLADAQKSR